MVKLLQPYCCCCWKIGDTMKIVCLITFLVCLGIGNCWLFDQTRADNTLIKRLINSHQRSILGNHSINKKDDKKRMTKWWEAPDIVTALTMLGARSSGVKSDNTVTLTVSGLYTLDLVWDVWIGEKRITSRGDKRKDGIIAYSEITLTIEDIDRADGVLLYVNYPDYIIMLSFDKNRIPIQQRNQRVNIMWPLFDGPDYPNRVRNDNSFEFRLHTPRNMNSPSDYLSFFHAFYDTEQVGNEYQIRLVRNVEYEAEYMQTRITAHLDESNPGELLYAYLNNINDFGINSVTNLFNASAYRYINIPRNQPASTSELLFFDKSKEVQSFPPIINYGSLHCIVTGTPVPTLEVSKDGQVIDAQQFTGLNMTTYVLVPFNGKTLDEVSGTYLCKASNGNVEAVQEIHVVGFNDN